MTLSASDSANGEASAAAEASPDPNSYFFAPTLAAASALPASDLAYLRRKRSTRPAVSTSFCFPVKNGWQAEQISRWMSPLLVERVVNVFPQAHITRTSL